MVEFSQLFSICVALAFWCGMTAREIGAKNFEVQFALDAQVVKRSSTDFMGKGLLVNNSATDVTISWQTIPLGCLGVKIVDSIGRVFVDRMQGTFHGPYSRHPMKWIFKKQSQTEFKLNVAAYFDQSKRVPGKYTLVIYYHTAELPKLASKELVFTVIDDDLCQDDKVGQWVH